MPEFVLIIGQVFIALVALLITIGAVCFPWWIRRIMLDVAAMRKAADDAEQQRMLDSIAEREFRVAQIAQLRALNEQIAGAQIDRVD